MAPIDISTDCPNAVPCKNSGTCFNNACCCPPGYAGDLCEQEVNECSSQPCQNGGTCTQPDVNMYMCNCPIGKFDCTRSLYCMVQIARASYSFDVHHRLWFEKDFTVIYQIGFFFLYVNNVLVAI